MRLAANGVLALRLHGLQELGPQPGLPLLRRQLRDARLRVPRSSSARRRSSPTPSCASRSSRRCSRRSACSAACAASFFANIGARRLQRPAVHVHDDTARRRYPPIIGYEHRLDRQRRTPVYGAAGRRSTASAWSTAARRTASASQSFLLGFPMHFDWSWKTLFNRDWEDALFAFAGRSAAATAEFRKMKFGFWIGYDF